MRDFNIHVYVYSGSGSSPEKAGRRGATGGVSDVRVEAALELLETVLKTSNLQATTGDIGWLAGVATEAKALIVQNNVLKAGMALLRKKNSEVC